MKLHDVIEKANQPQVAVPTTTTAATVGLLSASEWLTLLSILVVVMQLIIALPKFIAVMKDFFKWAKGGGDGQSGKAVRSAAAALAAVGGIAALLAVATPEIKMHEGKTNHAIIPVPGDVPTICHGHTATAVMGQYRTDAECEELLRQDLTKAFNIVARRVQVDIPQETWVALASFVFNVGEGNFAASTALKKINAGDIRGGCVALASKETVNGRCRGYGCGWAAGAMHKGLQRRRVWERDMCLKGLDAPAPPPPQPAVKAEPPWWKFWARWL